MKHMPIFVFALGAISSVSIMAQQPAPAPQEPNSQRTSPQATTTQSDDPPIATLPETTASAAPQPSSDSAAVLVPSTANAPEVVNPQLRPVSGDLERALDTQSAKTGDSVIVKTTQQVMTASGTVIPKGSKIVGHVTDVEAKGKSGDNSRMTIQFDQAELNSGQNMQIKSVLQSIEPAESPAGGVVNRGANGAGASARSTGQNSGRVASERTSPNTGGAASAVPVAAAVGTIIARNGNVAIRTTAIPGVLLATNADGQPFANAAGALLGAKREIHLDSGTHVVVAIVEASGKAGR